MKVCINMDELNGAQPMNQTQRIEKEIFNMDTYVVRIIILARSSKITTNI